MYSSQQGNAWSRSNQGTRETPVYSDLGSDTKVKMTQFSDTMTTSDDDGDMKGQPCFTLIRYGQSLLVVSVCMAIVPGWASDMLGFSRECVPAVFMMAMMHLGNSFQYMYAGRCESNSFAKASVMGRLLTAVLLLVAIQINWLPFRLMFPWLVFDVGTACWTHHTLLVHYGKSKETYNLFLEIQYALTGEWYGDDADD